MDIAASVNYTWYTNHVNTFSNQMDCFCDDDKATSNSNETLLMWINRLWILVCLAQTRIECIKKKKLALSTPTQNQYYLYQVPVKQYTDIYIYYINVRYHLVSSKR